MVRLVTRLARAGALLTLLAGVLLLSTRCSRGPDAADVRTALQEQLDAALGGRVLTVKSLVPAGSASLSGRDGRLKYFNAELEFARDYDFTNWNAHSVASLAALLGAGPKGVIGLKEGGNRAGDTLGVYGSAAFEKQGDRWTLVPLAQPPVPSAAEVPPAALTAAVRPQPHEVPPPSPAHTEYAKLGELLTLPRAPGVTESDREEILVEEFQRTRHAARLRLEQKADELTVAGGPPGGAYQETLIALDARAAAAGIALTTLTSAGSVENIRLLSDHRAQFALVQNDIADNAYAGSGRFAGAPQRDLRSVASLFPETIQLVTRAQSGISSVTDLKGKRVGLGPIGSGTRANALAILAANGITEDMLGGALDDPIVEATRALADGRLDAFFITVHAPAPALQRLAAALPLAWVPIGPSRELIASGLVPITMPPETYPGQKTPIPTLAATALLVTREDVPPVQVERMLSLLFEGKHTVDSAAVSRIALRTARSGVNLPWSPVADAWLTAHVADPQPCGAKPCDVH
jgi:TRAP transporter TAXI family solute receptor